MQILWWQNSRCKTEYACDTEVTEIKSGTVRLREQNFKTKGFPKQGYRMNWASILKSSVRCGKHYPDSGQKRVPWYSYQNLTPFFR